MLKSIAVIGLLILAAQAKDSNCTEPTECKAGLKPVYEDGQEKILCLAWKGDADRAALALLQRVLTAQGFCRVALCEADSLCNIYENPPKGFYDALVIGYESVEQAICQTTGHLLDMVGSKHFPGRIPRLHAALALSTDAACFNAAGTPTFYSNADKLRACHFKLPLPIYLPKSQYNERKTQYRILQDMYPHVISVNSTRAKLVEMLRSGTTSFFFIDSELWSDEPRVRVIDLPDSSSRFDETFLCSEKVRLLNHAPILFDKLHEYRPQPSVLLELLALEDNQTSRLSRSHTALITAAEFEYQQEVLFKKIAAPVKSRPDTYKIEVYKCKQDKAAWESQELKDYLKTTVNKIQKLTYKMRVRIDVYLSDDFVDCLDRKELSQRVEEMVNAMGSVRLLGVVGAGAGVEQAARTATLRRFSIAAYDAQPPLAGPDYASLVSSGPRISALVRALRQALAACNWQRAALMSEDTPAAAAVADGLRANLTLRKKPLPKDNATLLEMLRSLKAEDARVFVLNAGAEGVSRALDAGATLHMTHEDGYVWLARERPMERPPLLALLAPQPTVEGLAREPNKWGITTPVTNALLTMMLGYAYLIRDFDKIRYDHHTNETLQRLRENLQKNLPTESIIGYNLTFDYEGVVPRSVRLEPFDNATAAVCFAGGDDAARLTDGTRNCKLRTGDAFAPGTCLDLAVVVGAPALLLGALISGRWAAARRRRALRRREELLRAEACTALLERQGGAAATLARCHVERARLCLLGELGAGRHGRVWLAEIMGDNREGRGRYVAAKEPHPGCAPAEESELLREAGTLAGLKHEHVLALVGVCVVGGPPLVLTEQALFGDLQGYLVRRRALCGGADEEAVHVAAPALTRLAREAALALAYLSRRGLVHCDVRAANCLVDERRSLKLADFGMARGLGTGEGAAQDEYQCRRRKLVPVRWMPPESLARGVFSPASDVWALGVLIMELVTLGERPFGAMGSLEVVALVKAGRHARVPASCSLDTRHLALACWRRDPADRLSASDVAAWLADRPTALTPAPQVDKWNSSQDSDDDSGFGESPPPDITYK